jgi:hypothetical protein
VVVQGTQDVGCPEFLVSWVPSGMHLSLGPDPVPSEVLLAAPVPGLHLVHWAEDTAGSALAFDILRAQPRAVVEQMVDAPPASVLAEIDLDRAIARADRLRMPVRVPRDVLAGGGSSRVASIGSAGHGGDHVLVLPASHLLEGASAATLAGDADASVRTPEKVPPDVTVAVRAAVRAGAGQLVEPNLPMFVRRPGRARCAPRRGASARRAVRTAVPRIVDPVGRSGPGRAAA